MAHQGIQSRKPYQGPAIFSAGFRPMFLLGAGWAALSMLIWLFYLTGLTRLPTGFRVVDWHAHELLFGFAAAILCGFLFTAIPNWTGRLPVAGRPLAALALLWLVGRAAVFFGQGLPVAAVAVADLGFLGAVCAIIAREIMAGKNWRNLPVLILCTLFLLGNLAFHIEAALGKTATSGIGFRLGLGALIMLLGLIGGRVIPSFTRNWLARQGPGKLPVPFGQYDKVTLLVSATALILWVALPEARATGGALMVAGALHVIRLTRWAGTRALSEVLVIILHIGYSFVGAGYILLGAATVWPEIIPRAAGIHTWTSGAVAVMMLAVMTRASLGHSGRPLSAGWREMVIYGAAITAALARITASFEGSPTWLLHLSATAWIVAFAAFCLFYAPLLLTPKSAPRKANPRPAGTN